MTVQFVTKVCTDPTHFDTKTLERVLAWRDTQIDAAFFRKKARRMLELTIKFLDVTRELEDRKLVMERR